MALVKLTRNSDWIVNVRQDLEHAVERTLNDKLGESVSIEDMGAAGDNATIDDLAFQRAVNSGAKIIRLTPGRTYVLKDGFSMDTPGVILYCYGAYIRYIKPTASYYHCIRINADGCAVLGGTLACDTSYVRGDTGFGISIYQCSDTVIRDMHFNAIASAAIWATDSSRILVESCIIADGKADGIHMSDGCSHFIITKNQVRGCHDDHIAVVSDVAADGRQVLYGLVADNIVTDTVAGHAFLAIGCSQVLWESNLARGCKGPGFGSYFWNAGSTPADEDWVRDCAFIGNVIEDCGLQPSSGNSATSFYAGALKNCVIKGNKIAGAPYTAATGTPANCMLIANMIDCTIEDNHFHNSIHYGIACRDDSTSYAATFTGIHVIKNVFKLIGRDLLHLYPNATIGAVSYVDNLAVDAPYDTALGRQIYIGKTGSAKVVIAGNKSLSSRMPYAYDAATSLNVEAYSNVPALRISYTPNMSGDTGTPTGTATMTWYRESDTVHFECLLDISNNNGASVPSISLPTPARTTTVNVTGRNNTTGMLAMCLPASTTLLSFLKYDNTALLTTGANNVSVRGSYCVYM